MGVEVISDAYVEVNSVDLSDHVKSVSMNYDPDLQGATAMGHTSQKRLSGMPDWELTVEFYQDYDAGKVDATLWPLRATETAIAFRKSKTDAISATNPEYQGNALIDGLPIADVGAPGEVHTISVTFRCSDGVELIRDTTP